MNSSLLSRYVMTAALWSHVELSWHFQTRKLLGCSSHDCNWSLPVLPWALPTTDTGRDTGSSAGAAHALSASPFPGFQSLLSSTLSQRKAWQLSQLQSHCWHFLWVRSEQVKLAEGTHKNVMCTWAFEKKGWMQDVHPRGTEQPSAQELWRLLGSKAVNTKHLIQESFLPPFKETPSSNGE